MNVLDILVIVFIVVVALAVGLYFLNRWASKKMVDQQSMIDKTKQPATIYVIDKRREKPGSVNLPKSVTDQLPKYYRFMKMPFVKAKIGPQIITLMCDKQVYNALPVKKSVKVEIAGIYIVGMKGMKTKKELKALARDRRAVKEAGAPLPWYKKAAGLLRKV